MDTLPNEILEKIFIYVPKIVKIELVNKKWYSICKNINHKRDICVCNISVVDCLNCPSSYHECVCTLYHNVWIPICKHKLHLIAIFNKNNNIYYNEKKNIY